LAPYRLRQHHIGRGAYWAYNRRIYIPRPGGPINYHMTSYAMPRSMQDVGAGMGGWFRGCCGGPSPPGQTWIGCLEPFVRREKNLANCFKLTLDMAMLTAIVSGDEAGLNHVKNELHKLEMVITEVEGPLVRATLPIWQPNDHGIQKLSRKRK
jgi:hypothetical protein